MLCFLNIKQHLVLVCLCRCPIVQFSPDAWGGWQQCRHGRCWAHCNSPQGRGGGVYRGGVGWGFFILLFWLWFEAGLTQQWPHYYLLLFSESAPDFSPCVRNGGIWPYSVPRLCASTFVRGEEQQTMIIHSKTDLFFPLQLLVLLWSIPRLPMQQLALHWEFAGACSQMTRWRATSCATNQWATRGTVMGKQVRRPGLKGTPQPSIGKTSWCQSASACLVHCVCHQNYPICHHHLLCPSSPPRSAMLPAAAGPITGAKTGHGSSRDSRNGKGSVERVRGFLEGGHCIRTHVLHPWPSTVFLKSKSSYH